MRFKFNYNFKLIYENATNLPEIPLNPQYENKTISILPGKFNPVLSTDFELIKQYSKLGDKLIIFMSNNTISKIDNRILSTDVLNDFSNLLNNTIEYCRNDSDIFNEIFKIKKYLENNADLLSWGIVKKYTKKILKIIGKKDKYSSISTKFEIFLEKKSEKLYKNSENSNQIYVNKNLIENFIKINKLENVEIILSAAASPMVEAVNYINSNCKNCIIYLGTRSKQDNTWDSFYKKFSLNFTNEIIPFNVNEY